MSMLPGQLPRWLDYALSENTAAAMFRGLQGLSARWGELIAAAQAVMGVYQDLPMGNVEPLYDEQNVLPLIAASRILDAASQSLRFLLAAPRAPVECRARLE